MKVKHSWIISTSLLLIVVIFIGGMLAFGKERENLLDSLLDWSLRNAGIDPRSQEARNAKKFSKSWMNPLASQKEIDEELRRIRDSVVEPAKQRRVQEVIDDSSLSREQKHAQLRLLLGNAKWCSVGKRKWPVDFIYCPYHGGILTWSASKSSIELTLDGISNASGRSTKSFRRGETVRVKFKLSNVGAVAEVQVVLNVRDSVGEIIYDSYPRGENKAGILRRGETVFYFFDVPVDSRAAVGSYDVLAAVRDLNNWDMVYDDTEPGAQTKNLGPNAWLSDSFRIHAGQTQEYAEPQPRIRIRLHIVPPNSMMKNIVAKLDGARVFSSIPEQTGSDAWPKSSPEFTDGVPSPYKITTASGSTCTLWGYRELFNDEVSPGEHSWEFEFVGGKEASNMSDDPRIARKYGLTVDRSSNLWPHKWSKTPYRISGQIDAETGRIYTVNIVLYHKILGEFSERIGKSVGYGNITGTQVDYQIEAVLTL